MASPVQMPVDDTLCVKSKAKRATIATALSSSGGTFWSLGIDRDGTGISNHMIIQNGTEKTVRLYEYYINWGKARVAPEANLPNQTEDDALFHAAGGWAATGSSGIITYQLDAIDFLHIMWDCPYNFNHYCNFIGLYLCGKNHSKPSADLFNIMYQDIADPGIIPRQRSPYDLVCCGPGKRVASPTGRKSWGVRRPCEVVKGDFYVTMTMGDSHKTSSTVTILKNKPLRNSVTKYAHE